MNKPTSIDFTESDNPMEKFIQEVREHLDKSKEIDAKIARNNQELENLYNAQLENLKEHENYLDRISQQLKELENLKGNKDYLDRIFQQLKELEKHNG